MMMSVIVRVDRMMMECGDDGDWVMMWIDHSHTSMDTNCLLFRSL